MPSEEVISVSRLILVKHAQPAFDLSVSANAWKLSEQGRSQAKVLGTRLAEYAPELIVASTESKATETGKIAAEQLGVPFEVSVGLHEHDRTGVPFLPAGEFESAVQSFFANLNELVFGNETAEQAFRRFDDAVRRVSTQHPEGNLVIVAHGTVITLLVARYNDIEPFSFWKRLGLPSFVVLSRHDYRLMNVADRIE